MREAKAMFMFQDGIRASDMVIKSAARIRLRLPSNSTKNDLAKIIAKHRKVSTLNGNQGGDAVSALMK